MLQVHPFSVSTPSMSSSELTTFYVKVAGDWTSDLWKLASSPDFSPASTVCTSTASGHSATYIIRCTEAVAASIKVMKLEGPYGSLSIPPLHRYNSILFIAGGIGITPLISMLRQLIASKPDPNSHIKFIWATHTPALLAEFEGR
jgi:predicted ferric reductase